MPASVRLVLRGSLVLTLSTLVACGGAQTAPTAEEKPAARPATPARPDGEPLLPSVTAERPPVDLPAQEIAADAVLVAGGHVYVSAPLPADPGSSGAWGWRAHDRLLVDGERHGVAFRRVDATGDGTPAPRVWLRLVGEAKPSTVRLTWYARGDESLDPWSRRPLTVTLDRKAKKDRALEQVFWSGFADHIEGLGAVRWWSTRPFHAFAAGRASLLGGGPGGGRGAAIAQERRSDVADLMRLYTGMASVDEALQHDRGLLLRAAAARTATVPLDTIEGVGLPSHPWDEMIAASGREPGIEALAAHVPHDSLYVHVGDLRTAVKLADELSDWVAPVARAVESRPGRHHLLRRYQRELMIERTGLAEKLGHVVAHGVALTAGDPFLREGSDVSLVFHVRSRAALLAALAHYEARARQRRPDLSDTTYQVGQRVVRLASTADGEVRQHRLDLGEVLVLSNSRAAIERFVAVADQGAPALSGQGDFRYLRAIYPWSADAEDAFVFVGDAFVGRAVSPRTKILQARRMEARGDLMAVGFASLLHGWLEGVAPADAEALVESGLLRREELAHADGAAIELDTARGATSARWGRADALTALADVELIRVTEDERAAYERFRDGYQRYWSGYIDPIAVRLRREGDGQRTTVDARMLPLIEGTDYDDLLEQVGRAEVAPPRLDAGVQWTVALGPEADVRRKLEGLGREVIGLKSLSWVGDWAMLGTSGRAGVWDLGMLSELLPDPQQRWSGAFDGHGLGWRILAKAPVYAGLHVRNPLGLVATLTALRLWAQKTAPDTLVWEEAEEYRGVTIIQVRPTDATVRQEEGLEGVALRYCTVDGVFVVSLDLDTLKDVVDQVKSGGGAGAAGKDRAARQVDLRARLDPAQRPWLGRVAAAYLEAFSRMGIDTAARDVEALARGLGGLPGDAEARTAAALGYLGYDPTGEDTGGRLEAGADGLVEHSLYGSGLHRRWPELPLPGGPLTKLIDATRAIAAGLSFEGEGRTRGLHVELEVLRAAP